MRKGDFLFDDDDHNDYDDDDNNYNNDNNHDNNNKKTFFLFLHFFGVFLKPITKFLILYFLFLTNISLLFSDISLIIQYWCY